MFFIGFEGIGPESDLDEDLSESYSMNQELNALVFGIFLRS